MKPGLYRVNIRISTWSSKSEPDRDMFPGDLFFILQTNKKYSKIPTMEILRLKDLKLLESDLRPGLAEIIL
jgi:hypothetical protein